MKKFGIYAIAENLNDLYDVGIYGDEEEDYRCPVLLVGSEAMANDGKKTLVYSIGNTKDINDFCMALTKELHRLEEIDKCIPNLNSSKKLYILRENATAYRSIGYYAYTEDEAWEKFEKEMSPDTSTDWKIHSIDNVYLNKVEEIKR